MNYKALPKVELHRHLELSLRPQTLFELAFQSGFDVKTFEDINKYFIIQEQMLDLGHALSKFLDTQKLLNTTEILKRIAFEACEDAFLNDGIIVLELRYAPTFIQMGHEHLSFEDIHHAIVEGVQLAEAKYPMAVGLLCTVQRTLSVEVASQVIDFAIQNLNTFVGVDLADDENGFDCKPFAPLFQKAKAAGLGVTIHSGEADLPDAHLYPLDAIHLLGATRIGHGIQIHRSNQVMEQVRNANVVLEVCPTSNYLTNSIRSLSDHPIRKLLDAGIKVSINTDDPTIFGVSLVSEYEVLAKEFGFSETDFRTCNQHALEASFIDASKKILVWEKHLN